MIAHLSIGVQPLLAAALDRRGVRGRPILDVDGERAREFQRLVVRFGRKRDDQVEIQSLEIVDLFERQRPVRADVDADLLHRRGGQRIAFAFAHPG